MGNINLKKFERIPIYSNREPIPSRPIQNYSMTLDTSYSWINGTGANKFGQSGIGVITSIGFSFPFYEKAYDRVMIDSESGVISFDWFVWGSTVFPSTQDKQAIAIFGEEIERSDVSEIYYKILTNPNRFVIIFSDMTYSNSPVIAGSFEIILYENGLIKLQYKEIQNIQGTPICGVNRGEGDNYFTSYDNLNISISGYSIDFNYTSNTNPPQLNNPVLNPTSGNQDDLLNFSIRYMDSDNHPPFYVNLTINGTEYMMSKQNQLDDNYIDGCIYQYLTYLQQGTYNYTFGCYDGDYHVTLGPFTNPTISLTNSLGSSLNSGQVNPTQGYRNLTLYEFTVNYSDPDNNAPNYINITLDGVNYSMVREDLTDNNYMDGCTFQYITKLIDIGLHNFSFKASDGSGIAFDGPYTGAFVKSTRDYSNINLTNFNIASILSYDGYNPFEKYPRLRKDLLFRKANLYNETSSLTSSALANYDVIWFDDFGDTIPFAEKNDIFNWVISGGKILLTGDQDSWSQKADILELFNMSYIYNSGYYSGIISDFSPHPITKDVTDISVSYIPYLVNTSRQPKAYSCARYDNKDLIVSLEIGYGAVVIINEDSCFNWGLSSVDNHLLANNTFGYLYSINFNEYTPSLTNSKINPLKGNQSTLYTYIINYTDRDNNAPEYMNVVINGTSYSMAKQNFFDFNFTNGCIYEYSTYLNWASYPYEFFFECYDGKYYNNTIPLSGPNVSYTNLNAPILSNGGVNPTQGEAGFTNFCFTINYTDPDNNLPIFVRITLDGINYTMVQTNPSDVNYMDGCIFEYNTVLNGIMTHEFNFTVNDGDNFIFDGTYFNPVTNDTMGPIVSNFIAIPIIGAWGTIFTFTVEVWDYTGISNVSGYIQNPDEINLDLVTFYDDGNHNDGNSGDGIYGTIWSSAGFSSNIYFLDINATDLTVFKYENEYENFLFAVLEWSCEIGKSYRWKKTYDIDSPSSEGSEYIYSVADINITSNYVSTIWGHVYYYDITDGSTEDLTGLIQIENYNISRNLFDLIFYAPILPFLTSPIDFYAVNNSFFTTYGSLFIRSYIYPVQNIIRFDFSSADASLELIYSESGLLLSYNYYINDVLQVQYSFVSGNGGGGRINDDDGDKGEEEEDTGIIIIISTISVTAVIGIATIIIFYKKRKGKNLIKISKKKDN